MPVVVGVCSYVKLSHAGTRSLITLIRRGLQDGRIIDLPNIYLVLFHLQFISS